ncbi:hypothetical protein Tco_1182712 [Tanacetum coccineum]
MSYRLSWYLYGKRSTLNSTVNKNSAVGRDYRSERDASGEGINLLKYTTTRQWNAYDTEQPERARSMRPVGERVKTLNDRQRNAEQLERYNLSRKQWQREEGYTYIRSRRRKGL